MLATLDPARFRRLSLSARLRLRVVRRRQVRLAERLHRERFPANHAALGRLNLRPRGLDGWQ
jgi:hypothetical protein